METRINSAIGAITVLCGLYLILSGGFAFSNSSIVEQSFMGIEYTMSDKAEQNINDIRSRIDYCKKVTMHKVYNYRSAITIGCYYGGGLLVFAGLYIVTSRHLFRRFSKHG